MNMNALPDSESQKNTQPILLKFAPVWKRILAYLVDKVFLNVIEVAMIWLIFSKEIGMIYATQGDFDSKIQLLMNFFSGFSDILLVAVIVVEASYFTLLWFGGSQTLGMKLLKIAVIDVANRKLGILMCLFRYVIIFIASQLLYIPLIFVVNQAYRQRLHDFLTGTVVVEVPSREELERNRAKEEAEADEPAE